MRRAVRVGIAVLGAWLAAAPSVRAGIYISSEVRRFDYQLNRIKLLRSFLQSLALPSRPDDKERAKVVELFNALEAKEKADTLTEVDRADLGGFYLRFGDPRSAERVLSSGNSRHFLVLCNLAVANHELAVQEQNINRMQEAIRLQKEALKAWPDVWSEWSTEQWFTYRRVERLQLTLLEQRFLEMRGSDGRTQGWQTVDDLFPGFKLVGPSGEYKAGSVDLAELDRLPPDAPWLVRELMMAYPTDARLYWLFGEILNTVGRVEDALQVLDDLVNVNQLSSVRDLREHRRVLLERANLIRDLRDTALFHVDDVDAWLAQTRQDRQQPLEKAVTLENILWALAPPCPMSVPCAGPAATEAGWSATAAAIEKLQREELFGRPVDSPPPPPVNPPQETRSELPDWRVLGVGFGAGAVVTVLVGLQWNEWKRRRQAAPSTRQTVG
jgi:tetratricopeptide (TPR) repeat protein